MNEVAWRGIPDSTELMDGDLVSADVGMYANDGMATPAVLSVVET